MLPVEVTIIPQYVLFFNIGWIDTLLPLIVPHWFGGGAFNIFLIRQFLMSIPRDLDEAALVDGASYLQIFWHVLLPLCVPALATAAIITAHRQLGRVPRAVHLPEHQGQPGARGRHPRVPIGRRGDGRRRRRAGCAATIC